MAFYIQLLGGQTYLCLVLQSQAIKSGQKRFCATKSNNHRLQTLEKRLVRIKCCLIFSGVELLMQALLYFCCYNKETNFWLIAGFWFHYKNYTDLDIFYLFCTSLYYLYILYILQILFISYIFYYSCIYISYICLFLVVVP